MVSNYAPLSAIDDASSTTPQLTQSTAQCEPQYTATVLLTLRYINDDTGAAVSESAIRKFCSTELGWKVVPFVLPTNATKHILECIVKGFLARYANSGVLLSMYYAGHGSETGINGPGLNILPTKYSLPQDGIPIRNIIYGLFFSTSNDAFVILDCCHSGAAFRNRYSHQKEVLAACTREGMTTAVQEDVITAEGGGIVGEEQKQKTFTDWFIQAARSLLPNTFTVQDLRDQIDRSLPIATPVLFSEPNVPRRPIRIGPTITSISLRQDTAGIYPSSSSLNIGTCQRL